jgi:hypothetical protein
MKKIGFTGTSRGMTADQKERLRDFLRGIVRTEVHQGNSFVEFHHGDCIGADDEAATIAHEEGCSIVAHPGYPAGKPEDTTFRAFNPHNETILPAKEFLKRDHDIVNVTDHMIAAPHTDKELVRSGTWTTVRYARKANKGISFVYPNRRMTSDAH